MHSTVKQVLMDWREALTKQRFLTLLIIGYILTGVITYLSPIILAQVQARNGILLNDVLLRNIKPIDCSTLIFIFLYPPIGWMYLRSLQMPKLHFQLMWTFLLFYTFRFITIWLVPLEPPIGWINLQDPFTKIFVYDHAIVSKDLFFSGHVGYSFAIFLLLPRRAEKIWGLIVVICVAILILIQHVHYTIDVLAAPFFGYFSYLIAKKMTTFALRDSHYEIKRVNVYQD